MRQRRMFIAAVTAVSILLIGMTGQSMVGATQPTDGPPGHGECEHGNSQQSCRPDPQPSHGADCEEHGNSGGVNEDHCTPTEEPSSTPTPRTSPSASPSPTLSPEPSVAPSATPRPTPTTEGSPAPSSSSTPQSTPKPSPSSFPTPALTLPPTDATE